MLRRIWMMLLLIGFSGCTCSHSDEESEDFGPYPTKAEARKDNKLTENDLRIEK